MVQPTSSLNTFAPGARLLVRDAEWLVRRTDATSTGGQALSVVGISELVRDREAIFLTEVEPSIAVLDPADTRLVTDTSSGYSASLLYVESLLRQTPPTDERLYIGHRAAMDTVPYQLDPTVQTLEQPRPRILIADAVGLGKTLEAGILVSELIRRGRGKRIPTSHNPFYYYDKAIISIDTLKQDVEYRTYLENAYWDIIVIDEAHNVAERGGSTSLRARLAALLSTRSDTLIMLSATPHDGRARSFASLMNMLDPTAIADPDNYTREEIRGLFIRRFKKDIQDQVAKAFKERRIGVAHAPASAAEEAVFDALVESRFDRLDRRAGAGELFRTTLEKALFSSPAAFLATLRNRIGRLEKLDDAEYRADRETLHTLEDLADRITPEQFGRYRRRLWLLRDPETGFGWTGNDPGDRLVVFTERIDTPRFLQAHLPRDLGLKPEQTAILHGVLSDVDQQRVVEDFGREEAPVRLLIASDVASEGINLHYLCHRLIHFDIP